MEIEIYSKQNCHLCEVMIDTVNDCLNELNINTELKITDITSDKKLDVYRLKVPVLMIDKKMFAKYEVDRGKLMQRLIR